MSFLGRLFRRGDPHSLAAPYALDALEGAERERFERHLERCAPCAAEVRALSEDAVRLAWSTAAPAPAALRERVLAAVRTTPQEPAAGRGPALRLPAHVWEGSRTPERSRAVRPRPLLVPFATVTAAAALVVASLFAVQADRTRDELDTARDRAREIAHVLAAPDARATSDTDDRGRGIGVVASAAEGRAVVTLSGYGEPSGDRVHQLWLMRPGAGPRSLGLLDGDTPLIAAGLNRSATSLAVTVEPGGGSVRPTSSPIVQLALESVGFGE
ncbi:anti-sigma factor domain-containing protein [Streptomyces sp. NPDC015237]|uniref:anti-sigma factor n=1 Tax=Streptomyces sp. NPDC015237 TaxID=3364949 RepID=UPI0037016B75